MKQIFVGSAKTLFMLVLLTPLISAFIVALKIWWTIALAVWSLW